MFYLFFGRTLNYHRYYFLETKWLRRKKKKKTREYYTQVTSSLVETLATDYTNELPFCHQDQLKLEPR